jgi:hypothetical protein
VVGVELLQDGEVAGVDLVFNGSSEVIYW